MRFVDDDERLLAVPAVVDEDLPLLTFDDALTEQDIMLTPPPVPSRSRTDRKTSEERTPSSERSPTAASSGAPSKKGGERKDLGALPKPKDKVAQPIEKAEKPKDKLWKKYLYDSIGKIAPACATCDDQLTCFTCMVKEMSA